MKLFFSICFCILFALSMACFAKFHERMSIFDSDGAMPHAVVGMGFLLFAVLAVYRVLELMGVL